ncbi:MAG: hypothetical protein IT236_19035 [Bacteroidia bacterium]|nr:hypothetical protein [Bacteroidia bacterium]
MTSINNTKWLRLPILGYPFVFIFILCGCSQSILLKRKYTGGYYFNKANKTTTKSNLLGLASISTASEPERKDNVVQQNVIKNAVEKYQESDFQLTRLETTSNKLISGNGTAIKSLKYPEQKRLISEVLPSTKFEITNKSTDKDNKGTSRWGMVLQIFLCLFPLLCLLAVILHDSKKVTVNFWVTLVLHLTLLGYIIFSLLVVTNAIDLR